MAAKTGKKYRTKKGKINLKGGGVGWGGVVVVVKGWGVGGGEGAQYIYRK